MAKIGFEFDFALSFADENRSIVERFAEIMKANGFNVFYDDSERAKLWGRNLYDHLDEVYSKKARYCVMFLSEAYSRKAWTNYERKAAQARAFKENCEYILPVRLDDTEIPGINSTVGYLDLRKITVDELAKLAIEKVGSIKSSGSKNLSEQNSPLNPLGKLKVKKIFTQLERDEYLERSFENIETFFKETLKNLPAQDSNFFGKFHNITAKHFTAKIYQNGAMVAQCGIRLGGFGGFGFSNQIVYSNDSEAANSMNEWVSVADDAENMFLKSSGMSKNMRAQINERLTQHDAAEFFWGLLTFRLQQ